jgi:hypothetical protein
MCPEFKRLWGFHLTKCELGVMHLSDESAAVWRIQFSARGQPDHSARQVCAHKQQHVNHVRA